MSVSRPVSVFIIAGEESGDQLAAGLMKALREQLGDCVHFKGVGGSRMEAQGLTTLFPISETSIVGFGAVLANLPKLIGRVRETVNAVVNAAPDVLVIVDSPDFTHAVAKRVRKRARHIPIVDYVSPSVWAWRSGRAKRMSRYIDHVLALLPFEPQVHERLGGPPCTYVGHPLIERLNEFRPSPGERTELVPGTRPTVLVLPGSRRSEVERMTGTFGEALERVARARAALDVVVPTVEHVAEEVRQRTSQWRIKPEVVVGEQAKLAAFRRAHAALAASGTVTLELALAKVPMAVGYRIELPIDLVRMFVVRTPSIVLPNLVLGENIIPEFVNYEATPEALATALAPLLGATPGRAKQLAALDKLDRLMAVETTPSRRAAEIVLRAAKIDA